MSDVSDLMLFYTGWGNITSISVDWLYQRIYFVMNEKVVLWGLINFLFHLNHYCDLFYRRKSDLYIDMHAQIIIIEIDFFNNIHVFQSFKKEESLEYQVIFKANRPYGTLGPCCIFLLKI